jgi:5-methylcytosine-specific restriction endonuclease McrA
VPNARKRKGRNSFTRRARIKRLIARDGLDCARCGKPIDPDLVYPRGQTITVGHIVEYAEGGNSEDENLQLEHYDCNWKAGIEYQKKRLEGTDC